VADAHLLKDHLASADQSHLGFRCPIFCLALCLALSSRTAYICRDARLICATESRPFSHAILLAFLSIHMRSGLGFHHLLLLIDYLIVANNCDLNWGGFFAVLKNYLEFIFSWSNNLTFLKFAFGGISSVVFWRVYLFSKLMFTTNRVQNARHSVPGRCRQQAIQAADVR
jgi:hypothetical protein